MTDAADLIPHQPPMRLVERVIEANADRAVTEAVVREDNVFYDRELDALPTWTGLEYMAQTAAVWVGAESRRKGQPVQPAFLISSRHYSARYPAFPRGETLRITVTPDLIDGPLVAFSGKIANGQGELLVEGVFSAFQPEDVDAYLESSNPDIIGNPAAEGNG